MNAGTTPYTTAHYEQTADISLAAYQEGMGWEPIGKNGAPFKGVYDGQGYCITGLVINNSKVSRQGLFGLVKDDAAQLKNIVVKDAHINVSNGNYIGAVVGWYTGAENLPLTGCVMLGGSVTGGDTIGGVAGYATRDVEKCYATGSVNGGSQVGDVVGGLCADLCNCYSTGDVTGTGSYIGGVVGHVLKDTCGGSVQFCYATGNVKSTDSSVGGVVGYCSKSDDYGDVTVTGCVALGRSTQGNSAYASTCRVIGYTPSSVSGCYAWSGMTVKRQGTNGVVTSDVATSLDGASLTYTAGNTVGNRLSKQFSAIFSGTDCATAWDMQDDGLPTLNGVGG